MIVNIFEKEIKRENIEKNKVSFTDEIIADKYNAAIHNDTIFINRKWYELEEEEKTVALVNEDRSTKTSEIAIEIEEGINPKNIPMFGVTLEDNFNIQQFNLTRSEINGNEQLFFMIKNTYGFFLWDLNKKLHCGNGSYISENDIKKYVSIYKEQGYTAPLVLYADKRTIRPYYYDYIIYLYEILNLDILPVRVITYKDIKYLENLNSLVYQKIKNISNNKFYNPIDNEDMSKYMIENFSDKRKALKKYLNKDLIEIDKDKKYKLLDFDKLYEIIPYVFTEEKEELNKNLMDNIMNHKYSKSIYYENGERKYSMPISEAIYRFINGFTSIEDDSSIKDIVEKDDADGLKVKEEIDFDPSLIALDTFNYMEYCPNEMKKIKKIIDKFGPYSIYDKAPIDLFDMNKLNDVLEKDIKIKVLTKK